MTRGGPRNRSRLPVEGSGRSDRRGYKLQELPAEGYTGPIPEFPLPAPSTRELEVWEEAWRTPQACAWSLPSERWRLGAIALWTRVTVRCEDPETGAALLAQLHRFADQIGMTTTGLAHMGWKIAAQEDQPTPAATGKSKPPRPRRLRSVEGTGA